MGCVLYCARKTLAGYAGSAKGKRTPWQTGECEQISVTEPAHFFLHAEEVTAEESHAASTPGETDSAGMQENIPQGSQQQAEATLSGESMG